MPLTTLPIHIEATFESVTEEFLLENGYHTNRQSIYMRIMRNFP